MKVIENKTNEKNEKINNKRKILGKTSVVGEISTGCCLGNVVKSTMNILKYTLKFLS